MISNDKHRLAGRNIFMSSITGLANLLAVVVSFLGTPFVYGKTIDWVQRIAAMKYGHEVQDFVSLAWFVITALLLFFFARASIGTALIFGGLALATRFM